GGLVVVTLRVRFAAHVAEKRAQRASRRRRFELLAAKPREHAPGSDVTGRGALDVPFDARDLPGAEDIRARAQAAVDRKRARRIEKRIAVHLAQPDPLGVAQAGDAAREDPLLFRPGQPRLESDEVPRRPRAIFAAQLND